MKKIFFGALLASVSTFNLFAQTDGKAVSYKEPGSVLPPLRVVDKDNNVYTNESLTGKSHFFLMLFNPTCGHCIDMTKLIGANLDLFEKNDIVLMAGSAMMPYLGFFYNDTGLEKYPKIKVGVDSSGLLDKIYLYNKLPQINIYDKDRKLVKVFSGDTPLDSLKNYIP